MDGKTKCFRVQPDPDPHRGLVDPLEGVACRAHSDQTSRDDGVQGWAWTLGPVVGGEPRPQGYRVSPDSWPLLPGVAPAVAVHGSVGKGG